MPRSLSWAQERWCILYHSCPFLSSHCWIKVLEVSLFITTLFWVLPAIFFPFGEKKSENESHSVVSDSLWPHELQQARPPCPSSTPGVYSNSCPLSQWSTISSSVVPFSSCPQSFPASGSFPVSRLFTSGGHTIGDSASVLPMNIQGWFPLGLTGFISLQSKGLSRIFSNTTVQKHQFFGAQLSSQSNSHIHTRLLEKP